MPAISPGGGGGSSSSGVTVRAYSTTGNAYWAATQFPSGVGIDPTVEPFLDDAGRLTFLGWTGASGSGNLVTVSVLSSGVIGSAVSLTPYTSPTVLFPIAGPYVPNQPPNFHTAHTSPFTGGIMGETYFPDVAKQKNWNTLNASFTDLGTSNLGVSGEGVLGIAWGTGLDTNQNQTVLWAAKQRGWVQVEGGQVQWIARSPHITCWAPFGGTSNPQVWRLAETSETDQKIVLYTVLGATNGNLVVYREEHHWSKQTFYGVVNTINGTTQLNGAGSGNPVQDANTAVSAPQPTTQQRYVDSSSYSLILVDGNLGTVLASVNLTGYGGNVTCYRWPGVTMALCDYNDLDLYAWWATAGAYFPPPPNTTGNVDNPPVYGTVYAVWSDGTRTNGILNIFTGSGEFLGGQPDPDLYGPQGFASQSTAESAAEAQGAISGTAVVTSAGIKSVPRALITYAIAPEPNLNLSEYATDGTLIYLVSGTLTDGVASLPTANQEQRIRVSTFSATTLEPIWSVALPLAVATGATAKILALSNYLHLLVYDGTATTQFWLNRSDGSVVAPLDAVARTNPAQAFTATAGEVALAYGNTLRIYT